MSKAKHSYSKRKESKKKSEKSFFKKFFICLIVLLLFCILLGIGYFGFKYFYNDNPYIQIQKKYKDNEQFHKASEIVSITDTLQVKDAEYLEISGFKIKNEDNLYKISSDIENKSNESHSNIDLRIFFFDEKQEIITTLDYKIDNIDANGEISTFATLKRNLDNCKYYSVALKK